MKLNGFKIPNIICISEQQQILQIDCLHIKIYTYTFTQQQQQQ